MSRAGNYFSNKIGLNNFWYLKLNFNYSNILFFFFNYLLNLDKELKKKGLFLVNFSYKVYRGLLYLYLNVFISYYKLNLNMENRNYFLLFNNYDNKIKFSKIINLLILKLPLFFFNKLMKFFFVIYLLINKNYNYFKNLNNSSLNKKNKLNLLCFNKIKILFIFNYIKYFFINKYNLFLKLKFRSVNFKFLKYLYFKKKLKKYQYLFKINKLISLFYYNFIFKNCNFIGIFILSLFSSWKKNHFRIFKIVIEILKIFFKSNILNIKGIRLQIKGKVNGKKRKTKLIFSLGKFSLSNFNNILNYNYFSKLTIFGSIGFKLWLEYY